MRELIARLVRSLLRTVERVLMGRRAYKFILRDWAQLPDATAAADVMNTMRFTMNLEPLELLCPSAKVIAVIAPHPDDEMIGPGGTLIKAIRAGRRVHVVYLTDGHEGPNSQRIAEAQMVAQRVGYTTHRLRSGQRHEAPLAPAAPTFEGKSRTLAGELLAIGPEAIFVPFVLDDHPEHRAASLLLARSYLDGHLPGDLEVWAYQVYTSLLTNVVVDISEVAQEKAASIQMWRHSAMRSRDWAHYAMGLNAWNSRFLQRPPGEYFVETFFVLPLRDYAWWCERYGSHFGETPAEGSRVVPEH